MDKTYGNLLFFTSSCNRLSEIWRNTNESFIVTGFQGWEQKRRLSQIFPLISFNQVATNNTCPAASGFIVNICVAMFVCGTNASCHIQSLPLHHIHLTQLLMNVNPHLVFLSNIIHRRTSQLAGISIAFWNTYYSKQHKHNRNVIMPWEDAYWARVSTPTTIIVVIACS